jgi:hypothetical protein
MKQTYLIIFVLIALSIRGQQQDSSRLEVVIMDTIKPKVEKCINKLVVYNDSSFYGSWKFFQIHNANGNLIADSADCPKDVYTYYPNGIVVHYDNKPRVIASVDTSNFFVSNNELFIIGNSGDTTKASILGVSENEMRLILETNDTFVARMKRIKKVPSKK